METKHKDVWTFQHEGLTVEIQHWGKDEGVNDGKGIWNYYVYIYEPLVPNFAALWLEPRICKFSETLRGFVTYDYYDNWVAQLDSWHGGVTYYSRHGYLEDYRSVQFGCDYCHLWDAERDFDYTLDEVLADALATAKEIAAFLKPSQ